MVTRRGWHVPSFSVSVLALGLLGISYLRKLLLIELPMKYMGKQYLMKEGTSLDVLDVYILALNHGMYILILP